MLTALVPVIAAAATDPTSVLLSQGPLGAAFVAFATLTLSGRIVAGGEHDRVVAEKDELQRQLVSAVSAQAAATEALKESTGVMRDVLVMMKVLQVAGTIR